MDELTNAERMGATFYLIRALYAYLVTDHEALAHAYIGRALWTIRLLDERPELPS